MSIASRASQVAVQLDALGFDIGTYHVSLYRALLMIATVAAVVFLGRLAGVVSHRVFGRMQHFDSAQKLLGEKLFNIAAWAVLVLMGIDFLGINLTADRKSVV